MSKHESLEMTLAKLAHTITRLADALREIQKIALEYDFDLIWDIADAALRGENYN